MEEDWVPVFVDSCDFLLRRAGFLCVCVCWYLFEFCVVFSGFLVVTMFERLCSFLEWALPYVGLKVPFVGCFLQDCLL